MRANPTRWSELTREEVILDGWLEPLEPYIELPEVEELPSDDVDPPLGTLSSLAPRG